MSLGIDEPWADMQSVLINWSHVEIECKVLSGVPLLFWRVVFSGIVMNGPGAVNVK